MSVALVDYMLRNWKSEDKMDEIFKYIGGDPFFEDLNGTSSQSNSTVVLVIFIGGITNAEIESLRFLRAK